MALTWTWPQNTELIRDFRWENGVTPGSTWNFILTSVVTYPLAMLTLQRAMSARKALDLGRLPALHNLVLCLGSLAMFLGALQAAFVEASERGWTWGGENPIPWIVCMAPGTKPQGRMFFWSYVYYLSKFYELLDTVILVLKKKQLSFLHVFHHAFVMLMCFLWMEFSQSLQTLGLLTNTGIHVMMYYYFFMHSLGCPPPWKRFMTNCQIVQFLFGYVVSAPMVWRQLTTKEGCSGFGSWAFNSVFVTTLVYLFVDFHRRSYGRKNKSKKEA